MTRPTTEDDLAMRRSEHDAYEDMARHSETHRLPSGLSLESDAHTRHHMQASSQWRSPHREQPEAASGAWEQPVESDDRPWLGWRAWVVGLAFLACAVIVAFAAAGYLLHPYLPPDWLAFLFG